MRLAVLISRPVPGVRPGQGRIPHAFRAGRSGDARVGAARASSEAQTPPAKNPCLRAPEPALSGFGDRVPLTFAVRQIVPAHFQVAYADAVQKDAPVDWKGGEPWRATLADAVRPLGLVVTVSGPKVTIAAAPVR